MASKKWVNSTTFHAVVYSWPRLFVTWHIQGWLLKKKSFTQMIKAFTLLFIGVFGGVGLGALERLHGRRLWQKKTNKGCEWRRVVEAWQTCRIQAVEKQSRLPGWFPLGAWDGAPLLPSFMVFTTGAPSPSIYTQTQRNARMGINPQNVFLLELQIWASSAELFKCKCNEMSWVTPE